MKNSAAFLIILISFLSLSAYAGNKDKVAFTGLMSAQQLLANEVSFSNSYQKVTLSNEQISQLNAWPANLVIDIYFGAWCHDSQREVPVLLKAAAVRPQLNLTLIALDDKKSDVDGAAKRANIKYTPTFIVRLDDLEIGRVIERPKTDLISDISDLIAQQQRND